LTMAEKHGSYGDQRASTPSPPQGPIYLSKSGPFSQPVRKFSGNSTSTVFTGDSHPSICNSEGSLTTEIIPPTPFFYSPDVSSELGRQRDQVKRLAEIFLSQAPGNGDSEPFSWQGFTDAISRHRSTAVLVEASDTMTINQQSGRQSTLADEVAKYLRTVYLVRIESGYVKNKIEANIQPSKPKALNKLTNSFKDFSEYTCGIIHAMDGRSNGRTTVVVITIKFTVDVTGNSRPFFWSGISPSKIPENIAAQITGMRLSVDESFDSSQMIEELENQNEGYLLENSRQPDWSEELVNPLQAHPGGRASPKRKQSLDQQGGPPKRKETSNWGFRKQKEKPVIHTEGTVSSHANSPQVPPQTAS
ncbi:unnamed protein product, partial [Rhizoctonia solani]